jgi:hypothetical protein
VLDNLVEEEIYVFDYDLEEFIFHLKCQVLKFLLNFISFMHGFQKKKNHNMLVLILDLGYKNMCLVITYLGCEAAATLMANYDE